MIITLYVSPTYNPFGIQSYFSPGFALMQIDDKK